MMNIQEIIKEEGSIQSYEPDVLSGSFGQTVNDVFTLKHNK